jgi:hypothetical protein
MTNPVLVNGLRLPDEIGKAVVAGNWPERIVVSAQLLKACRLWYDENLSWWFRPVRLSEMQPKPGNVVRPPTSFEDFLSGPGTMAPKSSLQDDYVMVQGLPGRRFIPGPLDWDRTLLLAESGSYQGVYLLYRNASEPLLVKSEGHKGLPFWGVNHRSPRRSVVLA